MSKSDKKQKIDGKTLLKDTEKIFNFIDKFESLDLEKVNLNKLQKEINIIQEEFKEKYKDHIDEDELNKFEKDLDIDK